jgi:hypothetical protein
VRGGGGHSSKEIGSEEERRKKVNKLLTTFSMKGKWYSDGIKIVLRCLS